MYYKAKQIGRLCFFFSTTSRADFNFGLNLQRVIITILYFSFSITLLPKGFKL